MLIGMMPFLDPATKIEWTTYFGMPLIILTGAAGTAFITRRFEAIICGAVLSALWPAILGVALSSL
jgi:fucose permease